MRQWKLFQKYKKEKAKKKHNEWKHDWNACYTFHIIVYILFVNSLAFSRSNEPMLNSHFLKSYFKWCVWLVRALAVDTVQNSKINGTFFTKQNAENFASTSCDMLSEMWRHFAHILSELREKRKKEERCSASNSIENE